MNRWLFFSLFVVAFVAAQEKNSRPGEKGKGLRLRDIDAREAEKKIAPNDEKNPKGKAYGTKKEELSGKEFGMQRSREARDRLAKRMNAAMTRRANVKAVLDELQKKLQAAKNNLEQQKKRGTLKADALKSREDRIAQAEQKISALRDKLNSYSARVDLESEKEME
jgi:chromosome segregation ATPase